MQLPFGITRNTGNEGTRVITRAIATDVKKKKSSKKEATEEFGYCVATRRISKNKTVYVPDQWCTELSMASSMESLWFRSESTACMLHEGFVRSRCHNS